MYNACLVIVAGKHIAFKNIKSVHCCHGNAKIGFFALLSQRTFSAPVNNDKYYILWVCVCILALVIQHANHTFYALCYIVICGLSGLPHFSNGLILGKHVLNIKSVS
jgi:hypothetical protein